MPEYLFDTDTIINFFRNKEDTIQVFERLAKFKKAISVITLAEFLVGCAKSPEPSRSKKFFLKFLSNNKIKVYTVNRKIAASYVEIRTDLEKRGEKLSNFDLLIAATALSQNLILVTGNKKHFQRIKRLKVL